MFSLKVGLFLRLALRFLQTPSFDDVRCFFMMIGLAYGQPGPWSPLDVAASFLPVSRLVQTLAPGWVLSGQLSTCAATVCSNITEIAPNAIMAATKKNSVVFIGIL